MAIATGPASPAPLLRTATARTLDEFAQCFVRAQDDRGEPWAFVPSQSGGTFSNAALQNSGPYRLNFRTTATGNAIGLFAAADHAALIADVEQCR